MTVLMHICCSNCAVYPVRTLQLRGVDVRGMWFNPNIHPYTEYRNRLDALRKLQEMWSLDIEYCDSYGLVDFLRNVVNNERERCAYCYSVRLEKTAERAKETGADAFTTSLLVSPYQNIDMIKELGYAFQGKHGVEFFFEDFRGGFSEGRSVANELGLYRQKYCGCIYSEMERYMKHGVRSRQSGFIRKEQA
ncbi:MAG TPA: epoxyqueuosine reductase QueH [Dissulfurispiraceae bacterium]|nr:epoxyqueuosine reductase QueH [Dissulfurispiraceae bacterium]